MNSCTSYQVRACTCAISRVGSTVPQPNWSTIEFTVTAETELTAQETSRWELPCYFKVPARLLVRLSTVPNDSALYSWCYHVTWYKVTYYSRSVPSFTAISSYSCLLFAMSSRQPRQVSWEAATRDASVSPVKTNKQKRWKKSAYQVTRYWVLLSFCLQKRKRENPSGQLAVIVKSWSNLSALSRFPLALPGIVTIGVPAHRTSIPVVCPLQSGVSRQTSANCPLLTCSSLGATGEKMIRFWERPKFCAYCWILGSPTAGKRSSHSTLFGTLFRICKNNQEENTNSSVKDLSLPG